MEIKDEKKTKKAKKVKPITVKANKKGRHYMGWLNLYRILVLPFFYLLKPYKFYGNRKPPEGACVFVCNHYTMLDIAYVASTTWEGIHFIGKRSISDAPVVGAIAASVKMIPVNRDGNDVRALLDCFKCLKNGEKLAVFPEGTRNRTDADMLPFKHGASAMAIRTKSPILPMMIYKKPKWFRKTHILIGEPFEFTEYYDKKLTDEDFDAADEKLRQIMLALREEHTKFLENKKKKGKK
jgi:1-acyl-sn-glycerol-3-phosphate acyltransferase